VSALLHRLCIERAFVDIQVTLVQLEQLDLMDSPDSLEAVEAKDKLEDLDHKVCKYVYYELIFDAS